MTDYLYRVRITDYPEGAVESDGHPDDEGMVPVPGWAPPGWTPVGNYVQILGTEHDAAALIHRCHRIEVDAGETIVRAGDAADSMHFILDGRVGIMVPTDQGRTTRVRSLGRYTTIGEMGLVSHAPRSATIQAEVASVLYVLNTHQFEAIKADDPELSHKLLTYFVSVMAERLTFASRTIAVLRR